MRIWKCCYKLFSIWGKRKMITPISVEVFVNKVIEVPGLYPRFQPDNERIEHFYELMKFGQEFPPIYVKKDDSERHVQHILVGGKHRLEAARRFGKQKIKAFLVNEEDQYLLLLAARLNEKSSKPQTAEELRQVIRNTWEVYGVRDVHKIAEKIEHPIDYVRRVLKPLRDAEKEELKKKVASIRTQGLSERQIANQLGVSRDRVHRIIKVVRNGEADENAPPQKIAQNIENNQKDQNISTRIAANQRKSDVSSSISDKLSISNGSGQPKSQSTDKGILIEKLAETNHVSKPDTPKKTDNSQEEAESEPGNLDNLDSVVGYSYRHKPDETADNDCSLKEPCSIIPELEKLDQKAAQNVNAKTDRPRLTSAEKQALRVMELAGAGWNVEQIAKRIGRTEQFVRNVAASVIALLQNQSSKHPLAGRSHEEIAETLGIEPSVIEFMDEIVTHFPGVIPERKNIWWWLRENFLKYRSGAVERGSLIDIVRHETIYWKAVADNMLPSWEQEKEQIKPFEELPQDIEERFLNYMDLIDQLIDIATKGGFKADKITQAVLQRCNMVITIQNKLRRKLGQWNVPAEDNKNCESTG